MHILPLAPEVLFFLGPIGVTNAHLTLMLITLVIGLFGVVVASGARLVPGRAQTTLEMAIFWLRDRVTPMVPQPKYANFLFALAVTLFLMIVVSNLFFLLPITTLVAETADHHHELLLRLPTSHWSFTAAMGIMVVILSHILALTISPWRQINHFVKIEALFKIRSLGDLGSAILDIFIGFLEIVSQFSRVISISARLFGNIFAGEVMAEVIIQLSAGTQFLVPLPFYALGLLVGVIQAVVFTLLSIQYIGGMIEGVSHAHAEH